MKQELVTEAPVEAGSVIQTNVVPDVATDLRLVARSADEMKTAQSQLSEWFRQKQQIAERDLALFDDQLRVAKENGWRDDKLKRLRGIQRKRVSFYEKCAVAAEHGYCLIPNLNCDLFAARTTRLKPLRDEAERSPWRNRSQRGDAPPLGKGEYVDTNPFVGSFKIREWSEKEQKEITKTIEFNDRFDEVEFPLSIAHPEVMTKTGEAMAIKAFDAIGVLPERRQKGDPLALGVIFKPGASKWDTNGRVTFLIAWYVDTSTI